MNKTQGVELEIRKDDGNTIMVVQKQGNTRFSAGQRVVLASNGSQLLSLHAKPALRVVTWPHVCPCTSIVRVQFHNVVFKFSNKFNQKLNLL